MKENSTVENSAVGKSSPVNGTVGKKRIVYYDILLCFCIITSFSLHMEPTYFSENVSIWWGLLFTCGSATVLMTVGAKILPLHESSVSFLKRRLLAIVPAFIFWSLAYIALEIYFVDSPTYFWQRRLAWLAFVPSFGPAWFIYALIGLYLFAPIISPWIDKASKRGIEYFLAIWLFSGLIPFANEYLPVTTNVTIVAQYTTYLGYAVAGYYLARWPISERNKRERQIFWAVTVIFGVIYGLKLADLGVRYGYASVARSDTSLNVMATCMLLFALAQNIKRVPKAVQWFIDVIARNSLHIYLCHYAIILYVLLPMQLSYGATMGITTVMSIAAGWAFTRLEKILRKAYR